MRRDSNVATVIPIARAISSGTSRIRRARRLAGLTQEQAAQLVGVDVKTFRSWEHGRGVRAIDALVMLEAMGEREKAA